MPQYLSPLADVDQPATIAAVAAVAAQTAAVVATANGSDAATTQALANALKTELNKLVADVTALYVTVAASRTAVNAVTAAMKAQGTIAAA